ncbi:hypothetical protein [uncultured Lutibacter sp.]|uniref:hypothetical protein n=1 Tax=uncultured Lutibacter sp. TaxID=437739 RepID=UPI00261EDC26|nr:hypothetical protein [uncultured Lutibacter sp.]
MNLNILTPTSTNIQEFINFWSKQYAYTNENTYYNSITKKVFKLNDIQNLYIWKNGMKLSASKQKSLDTKIKAKLSIINTFKKSANIDIEAFKKEFKTVSSVWKIFLLHTLKPKKYPIYDQHIHRAFLFIHNEDYSNISSSSITDKNKELFYFNRYLQFIASINYSDLKKLDEAFFAFGQFLNTRKYATLLE